MKISGFTDRFFAAREEENQAERVREQGSQFKLADNWIPAVIIAIAILALAACNVGLFLAIIKEWYRWAFAFLAIAAEALLGYCIHSYLYTTGKHKFTCAVCGVLLLAFSLIHGGYFGYNLLAGNDFNPAILSYAHHYAWIVLSALVIGSGLALWLTHWKAAIAAEEAKERIKTAKSQAKLVGETERLQNKAALARARIAFMEDEIRLGNESADLVQKYATMRQNQTASLSKIPDEDLRTEIANDLGVKTPKPKSKDVTWTGHPKGNELGN